MKIEDIPYPLPKVKMTDIPVTTYRPPGKTLDFIHYSATERTQILGKSFPALAGLNCIGMELEVKFGANLIKMNKIREWAMKNLILNKTVKNSKGETGTVTLESINDLQQFYKIAISDFISPFVYAPPHNDDGAIEHIFSPVSLEGLQLMRYELQKVCTIIKLFGGEEQSRGAGIHLSGDKKLFGLTVPEEKNTTANWIVWQYLNREFMMHFSYRDDYNLLKASIDYALNDPLNKLSITEKIYKLRAMKSAVLDSIGGSSSPSGGISSSISSGYSYYGGNSISTSSIASFFNIKWNNDGRGINEHRFWGSTLEYKRIMSWYQWYFASVEYCRTEEEYDLTKIQAAGYKDDSMENFCKFVLKHRTYFPDLLNYLIDCPYSKNYLVGAKKEILLEYSDEEIFKPTFYTTLKKDLLKTT